MDRLGERRFITLVAALIIGSLAGCTGGGSSNTVPPASVTAASPTFSPTAGTYSSTQSVTISDSTASATIYYTTDGSTPTTSSTRYTGPVSVSTIETINAIATASGYATSTVASAAYTINTPSTPSAATPTFSPASGTYSSTQSVTISDSTANATIYYTTDGNTPTTSSTKYTGQISVGTTETIKAIATASGYATSTVASAAYTINTPSTPSAATPTFSPASGTYTSTQSVSISDSTTSATIYYTTDGSTPTTSSTKYTGPVSVSTTETINAIATASGYGTSPVAPAAYTINTPSTATPTFSPAYGTYTSTQSVTISDSTANATIYYTTDGSTPTTSSTRYTGPVSVSTTETIKAIATASGYATSPLAPATYTINIPTVPISISPTTITLGQSATVTWSSTNETSCTASGAWSGPHATSGSQSFTPTAAGTQTYGLSCTGSAGPLSGFATLTVNPLLGNGISISAQSTSVKPFEPIIFNVTNPTSGGSYQANFDIGNGTVITVPVIALSSSQLAVTAPAGAYSGSGSSLALSSGTVKIAIGWKSSTGTYSYTNPMSISIAALPTIPSTVKTGVPTIALLKAMKLIYLQADGKLLAASHNVPSMASAIASQRASIRTTLANLDSLKQLISQGASSGVNWTTIGGVQVTLSSSEVAFLDQLSAGQIQAIKDAAAQAGSPSASQAVAMRKGASLARSRFLGSIPDTSTFHTEDSSPSDPFDVQALAQDLAQQTRTIASTMGNAVGVVAGAAAVLAVAAGATASAPALAVIAATGFMVSTCLGTGIGATLDVGAEAIAHGSAAVSSLTPSAEFFVNNYIDLAESTIISTAVTETMGETADNLVSVLDNAYQIMKSSTAPAAQTAESNGQIPDEPTDMPDTYTVDESATEDPTTGATTVSITTTPATSTNVEVEVESSTGEQEMEVTVTDGSGSFQIPAGASHDSGEDLVIQTMTDGMDDVASSLDISSVDIDDSDLDSSELPNPDLTESVQSVYGSSSAGSGGSGSGISSINGTYTVEYQVLHPDGSFRRFLDSGKITGTGTKVLFGTPGVYEVHVQSVTITSVDGLFDPQTYSPPAGSDVINNGYAGGFNIFLEVKTPKINWQCSNTLSSSQGSLIVLVPGNLYWNGYGSCSATAQ